MARATVKQVFAPKSDNPLVEAKALYDQFKLCYGANPILDQAVRLLSHCAETNCKDPEVKQRTYEAVRLTDEVDRACTRVARIEGATKEAQSKMKLVRDIHAYLYDSFDQL